MKTNPNAEPKRVHISLDESTVAPKVEQHMTVLAEFYPTIRADAPSAATAGQVLVKLALCVYVEIVSDALGVGPDTAMQAIVSSPQMQAGILAVCGVIVTLPTLPSVPGFPFNLGELYVAHQLLCGPNGEIAMIHAIGSGAAHFDLSQLPRVDAAKADRAISQYFRTTEARNTPLKAHKAPLKTSRGETIN